MNKYLESVEGWVCGQGEVVVALFDDLVDPVLVALALVHAAHRPDLLLQ